MHYLCMLVCLCSSVIPSYTLQIILMHLRTLVVELFIAAAVLFLAWNYLNIVTMHVVYDYSLSGLLTV